MIKIKFIKYLIYEKFNFNYIKYICNIYIKIYMNNEYWFKLKTEYLTKKQMFTVKLRILLNKKIKNKKDFLKAF